MDLASQSLSERQGGVSVVIPHRVGRSILAACLESLEETLPEGSEVIVVDTGCEDGSIADALRNFSWIEVVDAGPGAGYARGCNVGIDRARSQWIVLLNDDAIVQPGCVQRLLEVGERSPAVAALQPKVLSAVEPGRFDSAGAAGGFIDRFGFPFARGRLFDCVEEDRGQYDSEVDIFWGSGVCLLIRKEALDQVGTLDQSFFAHMEEIDLCWRMGLAGWRIVFVPEAQTHHLGGATLARGSAMKVYLNHRNGVWMMIKNLSTFSLITALPVRFVLDLAAAVYHLVNGRMKVSLAVLAALFAVVFGLPRVLASRLAVQRMRKIPESGLAHLVLPRSVAVDFYLRGIRYFENLNWKASDI